jgi:RimJ/RimL family protein N-acetyltransferase
LVLEGETVVLRAMEKDDLEELRMLRNETYVDGLYRQYRPLTSKDQERYWDSVVNHENYVVFVVVVPEVGEGRKDKITVVTDAGLEELHAVKKWRVVGEVRSGYINWRNRTAELGVFLGKEYQHRGFGSETLYLFLDHYFKFLNMRRIEAVTVTPRVMFWFQKFGFKLFGQTAISNFFDGEWRPDYYLELYQDDWFANRKQIYDNYIKPKLTNAVAVI